MPLTDRPDVLFLSLDTLRRDRMAPYGPALMPTLTGLLEEGVAFDKAFATAPWTAPSFGSIFTGLWPRQHGALARKSDPDTPWVRSDLRSDVPVLTEFLADAGYHTICSQANFGQLSWGSGFDRAFAEYEVCTVPHKKGRFAREKAVLAQAGLKKYLSFVFERLKVRRPNYRLSARRVLQEAGAVIRQAVRLLAASPKDKPVFLWVNLLDMHHPYWAPPKWMPPAEAPGGCVKAQHVHPHLSKDVEWNEEDREYVRRRYDNCARYMDRCIRDLLTQWDSLREARDRLAVFLSDHGEEFWEHGDEGSDPLGNKRGVLHGHTLYNELIRVPLVFHWPGVAQSGRRVQSVASLVDFAPTILDLLGIDADVSAMVGRSLCRHITAAAAPPEDDRVVFSDAVCWGRQSQAAVSAKYKMIRCEQTGRKELYAWGIDDSLEKQNLAGSGDRAGVLDHLTAAMNTWNESMADSASDEDLAEIEDEEMRARLRDLGYV